MNTTTSRTAEYKGRKYRLLFIGNTKYGRRAHLEFFDSSKNFWVDAGLVSESNGKVYDNRIERESHGAYCGYPCPVSGRKCCPANGPCHDCQ